MGAHRVGVAKALGGGLVLLETTKAVVYVQISITSTRNRALYSSPALQTSLAVVDAVLVVMVVGGLGAAVIVDGEELTGVEVATDVATDVATEVEEVRGVTTEVVEIAAAELEELLSIAVLELGQMPSVVTIDTPVSVVKAVLVCVNGAKDNEVVTVVNGNPGSVAVAVVVTVVEARPVTVVIENA